MISAEVTIGTLPKVPGSTSVQQQTITSSTEAVNKGKVAQNIKATFTFNYQAKASFKFAKKTSESFKAKVSFGIPYTDAKGVDCSMKCLMAGMRYHSDFHLVQESLSLELQKSSRKKKPRRKLLPSDPQLVGHNT